MVITPYRVVWRPAILESGGQCVQKSGMTWTPVWSVDNLGLNLKLEMLVCKLSITCNSGFFESHKAIVFVLHAGAAITLFGERTSITFLDGVRCVGNESQLVDCPIDSRYEGYDCNSSTAYAGVMCGM